MPPGSAHGWIPKVFYGTGCLVSLLAPILGFVLYPHANWLFAFLLVGVAIWIIAVVTRTDPSHREIADSADRILTGTSGPYEIDDYEHLNPRNPELQDLWRKTLGYGLPEEWIAMDQAKKDELHEVIRTIRELPREPEK